MRRLVLMLSWFFPLLAGADVLVTVKIESLPMSRRYLPRTAEVEQAIATELAKLLPSYFRHWKYVPAASGSPNDYTLHFRIHKRGGDQVVTMAINAKSEIGGTWEAVWMPAGELAARGFPTRTLAGPRVATEIAQVLLDVRQQDIVGRMKLKVPVATAAQWQRVAGRSEEPRLVVPLRWPGSKVLVNSAFRVKCTWPGKGPAELQTRALDTPATYNDAQASYDALTLKPVTRIFAEARTPVVPRIAGEVRKLQQFVIYLEEDDPMGLHQGAQP